MSNRELMDKLAQADVERAAKAIYDHWEFRSPLSTPAWVDGGNSLMQDRARAFARAALAAQSPTDQLIAQPKGEYTVSIYGSVEAALRAERDTLLAENARNVKDAPDWHSEAIGLFEQIRHAAEHLPEFVVVHLAVENGAGWVYWSDRDGNVIEVDGSDSSLSEQFAMATDAAIDAAKERGNG